MIVTDPRSTGVPPATETPWTLEVLGAPEIAFAVYGSPGPQGSKTARPVYTGRGANRRPTGRTVLHESSAKVRPWREAVAAVAARHTLGGATPGWTALLTGPLVVDMIFTMPKGSTLAKWLDWHDRIPDLSKLARSTEDALTGLVWGDDGQITGYRRLEARFEGSSDPDTLRKPGAVVRVWRVPDDLITARKAASRRRA
jgi:Holliday junction resolvase RusA-like endonuclease